MKEKGDECIFVGPQMSKQRFASQVVVNHNVSKPVTQHSLPKKSESAFAKPDHMIASSSSRNNSKNMPRFNSNDMVHNHYLDEAKKRTQERDRNSKPSMMTSARFQSTSADSKPKPRSTNHSSRSLPMSKRCHKCVFNTNHDACITKLLKEVNSRTKIQSHKTRDSNKPVDQKSHTQTPGRQIFTGHKFSSNKNFAVYKKTFPRSDLRWKPTGRIFKSVGFRWLPTGKLFDSCTSKVEPTHGFNADISNIHECKQILDLSAGTSINVTQEQSLAISAGILWNVNKANLRVCSDPALTRQTMAYVHNSTDPGPTCQRMASVQISSDPALTRQEMASVQNSTDPAPTCQEKASVQISSDPAPKCQTMALEHNSLSLARNCEENVSHGDKTGTTSNELDLLFSLMFDELLNGSSKVVSKSSTVSTDDAPNQRQQPSAPLNNHTTPASTCQNPPITTSVISSDNINQAEPHAENDQVADDEFINIFSTPVQDQGETSSRH
nr:hypothetical protein [Tanacetum cinerariifolium]